MTGKTAFTGRVSVSEKQLGCFIRVDLFGKKRNKAKFSNQRTVKNRLLPEFESNCEVT